MTNCKEESNGEEESSSSSAAAVAAADTSPTHVHVFVQGEVHLFPLSSGFGGRTRIVEAARTLERASLLEAQVVFNQLSIPQLIQLFFGSDSTEESLNGII